ncbi:MAG TPA: DUF2190 family protein [Defluviitoga tunisiensis]|nr:DUF2190 family protein [bacterium]HPP10244.1 DUF2190 family protein [Defluviitoga tunisiensis]
MAIKGEFLGKIIPVVNDSQAVIEPYRVLTYNAGKISKAASNSTFYVGVSSYNNLYGTDGETPDGEVIDVVIDGVAYIVSATDITEVGTEVYAANDGKVDIEGSLKVGIALTTAELDGLVLVLLK